MLRETMKQEIIDLYLRDYMERHIPYQTLMEFYLEKDNEITPKTLYRDCKAFLRKDLNEDNLLEYDTMQDFGLTKKCVQELLGIGSSRVDKLCKEGKLTLKCSFEVKGYDKYTVNIYSIRDLLSIQADDIKPLRKKSQPVEATTDNIAQALYLINKSAKVSRDTKQKAYDERRHTTCRQCKSRENNLYELKDDVMNKLIRNNEMKFIGYHLDKYKKVYAFYGFGGFTFHRPYHGTDEIDASNCTVLDEMISSEKTIETTINFTQAHDLLKRYVAA